MNIAQFLVARIAEDERHARKLAEVDRRPILSLATTINHPQRLLAECAAKRAIVAMFRPEDLAWGRGGEGHAAEALAGCLLALAAIYSDHPDYQQEWAE